MVCGPQVPMNVPGVQICMVQAVPAHAPGIWCCDSGASTNNGYWQTPTGVWNIGAVPMMPAKGAVNHSQTNEQPLKPLKAGQTAARAAKRQRGRERRKLGKALAAAQRLLGTQQIMEEMDSDNNSTSDKDSEKAFEARAARLQGEVKVTVKRTFLEVDTPSEDEYLQEPEIELPTPIFELSSLAEEWRRDYRKFRCGFYRGSKGEISDLSISQMALNM